MVSLTNKFAIEIITDTAGFAGLEQEWNELLSCSRSDCLFLSWDWLFLWYRFLAQRRRLLLVTVRQGGLLIAIAPFARTRPSVKALRPYGSVEFLGTGTVGSDYLDLIVRRGYESPALQALGDFLTRHKLPVDLTHIRRGNSLAEALAGSLAPDGWRHELSVINVCPYINLHGQSWEGYLRVLSNNHRYNFQRRLKTLQKRFEFRFEQALTEDQGRSALDTLIRLHNLRWRTRGGSNAFNTPELVQFHHEFCRRALCHGWLRLYQISLDGRAVAALYGMQYKEKFYFYQSGFDTSFSSYSVGLVLMGLVIESAIRENVREYDLLHGNESYKSLWAGQQREIGRLTLYPPDWRGVFYRQAAHAAASVRRSAGSFARRYESWISLARNIRSYGRA